MQKIIYTTVNGSKITITDDNTSSRANGTYIPIHLVDFDGNAEVTDLESYERVGKDGTGIYGAKVQPRSIEISVSLLPDDGKMATAYSLRRELINAFATGREGILTYINDTGTYEINCFVADAPPVECKIGKLHEAKFYLTAACPFWRKQAEDITLTLQAMGSTINTGFTANTEYKVPVCVVIGCNGGSISSTDAHVAKVEVAGTEQNPLYKSITATGNKSFVTSSSSVSGAIYVTKQLDSSDSIMVDWGIANRFYVDKNKYSYIDFVNSTPMYIYPGYNKVTLSLYDGTMTPVSTGGTVSLTATIRRYDYVRSV